MFNAMKPADVRAQRRFMEALKAVVESHSAPQLSSFCMQNWSGETPWSGVKRDDIMGRLLIEVLEAIRSQVVAPPFCGNEILMIRTIQTLSNNSRIKPSDCGKLLRGEGVPKYVARHCEWLFENMRQEGIYVY